LNQAAFRRSIIALKFAVLCQG